MSDSIPPGVVLPDAPDIDDLINENLDLRRQLEESRAKAAEDMKRADEHYDAAMRDLKVTTAERDTFAAWVKRLEFALGSERQRVAEMSLVAQRATRSDGTEEMLDTARAEVAMLQRALAEIGVPLEVLTDSDADKPIEGIGPQLREMLNRELLNLRAALSSTHATAQAFRESVRREALEEAATVAQNMGDYREEWLGGDIAAALRALARPVEPSGQLSPEDQKAKANLTKKLFVPIEGSGDTLKIHLQGLSQVRDDVKCDVDECMDSAEFYRETQQWLCERHGPVEPKEKDNG